MGVGFLVLLYVPMVVVAWVKVGPVAGVAATVFFFFVAAILSQPGASLFGSGPYASSRRARSDTDADRS